MTSSAQASAGRQRLRFSASFLTGTRTLTLALVGGMFDSSGVGISVARTGRPGESRWGAPSISGAGRSSLALAPRGGVGSLSGLALGVADRLGRGAAVTDPAID